MRLEKGELVIIVQFSTAEDGSSYKAIQVNGTIPELLLQKRDYEALMNDLNDPDSGLIDCIIYLERAGYDFYYFADAYRFNPDLHLCIASSQKLIGYTSYGGSWKDV